MDHGVTVAAKEFVTLNLSGGLFLIILGFLGGLISGFIGSGGAFVLTPGMMSLGAPAAVAVASNMCHKFPKALVGAYKRYKYGQVDLKLGLIMGLSAIVGVQIGVEIQKFIYARWGSAGSNLYVSVVFVVVLVTLGSYVLFDGLRRMRTGEATESTSNLARRVQQLRLWPMVRFKTADATVSLWITVPLGMATGMLAATIAVGGFIGVPGMIYVIGAPSLVASATELVIAFVMGLSGTLNWALSGFVDLRMTLLILLGSLIGVQLGAVGTTYVRDYMVKLVMSTVMLIVAVSRGVAIPTYLHELGIVQLAASTVGLLKNVSFLVMCFALATGGVIIVGSMWKRKKELRVEAEAAVAAKTS